MRHIIAQSGPLILVSRGPSRLEGRSSVYQEVSMRYVFLPAASLAFVFSCSSGDTRRSGDTGMAESGAGGLSAHDTMPSDVADTAASASEATATPGAVLSQMNLANTTEIQLGRLASKQASSPRVKQIAQRLVTDHTKNREQLQALARQLNVTLTPAQGANVAAADSAAMPADLQGKRGGGFDRAFIQHEISDHQSNIEKLQSQVIPSVQNDQLKSYLQKTLTEMQAHLTSLQQVQQKLGS
jgi:putative membrane protein